MNNRDLAEQVIEVLKNGEFTKNPSVLIIEDSLTVSGLLKRAFDSNGYNADVALNAQIAESYFKSNLYDVAVIDYHLPDNMGDNLLDIFHKDNPECVCVMITTDSTPALALNWIKRGASAYIRKPFEPEYLIAICDRARRERSLLNVQSLLEISQQELIESQERLITTQRIAKLGGWELNIATKKLIWSQETYRIFEIDPTKGEITYDKFWSSIHPDDREYVKEMYNNSLITKKPYSIYHRILMADGRIKHIHEECETIYDDEGNAVKSIGTAQDITEQKLSEEENEKLQSQLTQAQKMESIGRLAGGVAHDLNNMLSVIIGNTEIVMDYTKHDETIVEGLREVLNAAERSANLTRQLLAFARKQNIAPKIVDLNETIKNMLKMLGRIIGEDIDLQWQPFDGDLWQIKIDPSQIDQILANLCVNARDAINGVGSIIIKTQNIFLDDTWCSKNPGSVSGEYVKFSVTDSGCGMDKETVEHIFEPFFTTKEIGKGTGLGLSTVYGVVKQNRGFIKVNSKLKEGSRFNIYLPRYVNNGDLTQIKLTSQDKSDNLGSETILLVEDEVSILKLTKTMLERQGYKVLAAEAPYEAIELAQNHSGTIDLLITDVIMPEMNGRELAKKILSIYPNIKRLFMSGYTADVIARHGVLDEGVRFIEKPFSKQEIMDKVKDTLLTI
ncbi:MAG: response regulator [Desulfamplus sp.]|nr:response regulator [Desulfamplus sp.]